jgi:hypothetical protein
VLVLGSNAEDVVVALLSVQTFPLCVVGHAREFIPKTLYDTQISIAISVSSPLDIFQPHKPYLKPR